MFSTVLFIAVVAVVSASSVFVLKFRNKGTRERIIERFSWYLGLSTLTFLLLHYTEAANAQDMARFVFLGVFLAVSALIFLRQAYIAFNNWLEHHTLQRQKEAVRQFEHEQRAAREEAERKKLEQQATAGSLALLAPTASSEGEAASVDAAA